MMTSSATSTTTVKDFLARLPSISTQEELEQLRREVLDTENTFRELFARQRENWEIPEVDDPFVFLTNVFDQPSTPLLRRLPLLDQDTPRCFDLGEKRAPEGSMATVDSMKEFLLSWDCLTEGLLRHLDWSNIFCAGGAVAGCLAPLPEEIQAGGSSATRVKRRKYFHETYLPGSDIDLFLYGMNEEQAVQKLQEIYDAIQAANPYEVRAFRSKHAITLVSQYPFRHVQIVLRLYNSPSEILMGFDVDACSVGFDGTNVWCCPRTALAMMTQSNTVDVTRRSPSYEMRLAKYAERGFDVLVPSLQKNRIDPFLYEKRFDEAKGLARLLLLERLRTPEERLRYHLESQYKMQGMNSQNLDWMIQRKLRERIRQVGNLERAEGADFIVPAPTGAELSNYSTVYLPWGPDWTAQRIERVMKKKDKILNKVEFSSTGRVIKNRRKYKVHLCAVGTMAEVIKDPFPDDPPFPKDVPEETLESLVYGPITWLVDNPGRQQIGSFHPINDDKWTTGAYFSHTTEKLIEATFANDADTARTVLEGCENLEDAARLLLSRDFLGRTVLHVAVLADSVEAMTMILRLPGATAELWSARTSDGRNALHLACIHNRIPLVKLLLDKRSDLISQAEDKEEATTALDIDTGDWEVKMSALHYCVVLGHVDIAHRLLSHGAMAKKIAIHKDKGKSESSLSLLALYASECGPGEGLETFRAMAKLLLEHGASPLQVDTQGYSCWHRFAICFKKSSLEAMGILLDLDSQTSPNPSARGLDVIDKELRTPLYVATALGNVGAAKLLLKAGASASFSSDEWDSRIRQMQSSGHIRRYHYGNNRHAEMETFRCPIALAAKLMDVDIMEAFVSADPSLATTVVKVVPSYGNDEEERSILDLVHEFKASMLDKTQFNQTRDNLEKEIERSAANLAHDEKEQSAFDELSYEWKVWAFQLQKDQTTNDENLKRLEDMKDTEEEKKSEEDAREQIDKAIALIESAGGKRHSDGSSSASVARVARARSTNFGGSTTPLPNPFATIREPQGFNFHKAVNMSIWGHYSMANTLSEGERLACFALMSALSGTDPESLKDALAKARICIFDAFHQTPMFYAVWKGKLEFASLVFEKAFEQYHVFVTQECKRNEKMKEKYTMGNENDLGASIQNQIRRLNNLDIAAGEVPRNEGPDREQLRLQVEAAEVAASQQHQAGQLFSSVPPEFLLLYRSEILDTLDSTVADLKNRLHALHGDSFPTEWLKQPLKLRPLELAVIRGDEDMAQFLLSLAGRGSSQVSSLGDESGTKEPSDNVVAREPLDDGDSEDDDDDGSGVSDEGNKTSPKIETLTLDEMRYLLTGEASANSTLGGMTLLQLAIVVGNTNILQMLLAFAKEYALPRVAIGAWKRELDNASSDASRELDPDDLQKLEQETKVITGEIGTYLSVLDLWSFRTHSSGRCNHVINSGPTLLQFALAVESYDIVRAVISGSLTDHMFRWLEDSIYVAELQSRRPVATNYMKGERAAAMWLVSQDRSKSELSSRLLQVTALDVAGRNALFYTRPSMIDTVKASAMAVFESTGLDPVGAMDGFLNLVSTTGFATPLSMAVSCGDVDLLKALLNAGCNPSLTFGPKSWNALHWAVKSWTVTEEGTPNWQLSTQIIQLLLENVTGTERKHLLLSPNSEHTPLMLATSTGMGEEVIALLLRETASTVVEAIQRRDNEFNSILHIATEKALNTTNFHSYHFKEDGDVGPILQQLGEFAKLVPPLAENARGVTSVEMALQSIVMIWNRIRDISENRQSQNQLGRKRAMNGMGQLPVKRPLDAEKDITSKDRSIYQVLNHSTLRETRRTCVTLEQVQKVKEHAAKRASDDIAKTVGRISRRVGEQEQISPTGPPAVFARPRISSTFRF